MNRNYIIERLKSKTMSIDEFNFETLSAPPIYTLFTPYDIECLRKICTSIRYSGKPKEKFKAIDEIMRRRGFAKLGSGTNRVVYRYLEDDSFVAKVAIDDVGRGDNPRELVNQNIFKPFVTKCFEITPCGTLGLFERVKPIISRQEFLSIAADVYEVINDWFIGEYVLEDIGTKYFMNYGIRKGFGVVLLDYPYVYKLDGNKLFCNAKDLNSQTGFCEGTIDYDPGFNFLYCTKCGVKYRAGELAEAVKNKNIITKTEGDIKMKVRISGGSKNFSKTVVTEDFGEKKIITNNNGFVPKPIVTRESVEQEEKETKKEEVKKTTTKKSQTKSKKQDNKVVENSEEKTSPIDDINNLVSAAIVVDQLKNIIDRSSDEEKDKIYDLIAESFDSSIITKMIQNKSIYSISVIDENSILYSTDEDAITVNATIRLLEGEPNENGVHEEVAKFEEEIYVDVDSIIDTLKDNSRLSCDVIPFEDREEVEFLSSNVTNIIRPSETDDYIGFRHVAAKTINAKDIFNGAKQENLLIVVNGDGTYMTTDKQEIVAIDMIDDKHFDALSIVSSNWKEMSTGTIAPNNIVDVSVNGVPVEDEDKEE